MISSFVLHISIEFTKYGSTLQKKHSKRLTVFWLKYQIPWTKPITGAINGNQKISII